MIIDAHTYCFPPLDSPAGHESAAAHLRWVQAAHAHHHQPAWRVSDRTPVNSELLAPGGLRDLHQMPGVNFHVDRQHGRVAWTVDGTDYTMQLFPPNLRNMEFTPHSLIAEMDYAGVDMALLHTDPTLGREAEYQAECVRQFPDRLRSMAPVDEWQIKSDPDREIEKLHRAIDELGLHAIKFIPPLAYLEENDSWDDGPFRPFWKAAASLGVPVFFTLGTGPGDWTSGRSPDDVRRGYLGELSILQRWMDRYPDVACCLTHGFPWRAFLDGDQITLPEAIWEPFTNPQCHLEVSFPIRLGDRFDFPYREVWPVLEQLVEKIGPEQLTWGTDMPFQNRFCTYRQSRDWIERYCGFLEPAARAQLMGGTAARILGISGHFRRRKLDKS